MSTLSLNNNIPSLRVQRNLNQTTNRLRTNFERLSSGMRINKASDDAGGLAVANSIGTDKRVYLQGIRNFNDGISLLNVAEGAVSEMMNILTRVSEIAAQGANGAMSDVQRSSLQSEASAIQSEYNRIINSTKFNNMNPLTGENTKFSFQGGYGVLGSITAQIGKALVSDAFGLFSAGETTRVSTSSSGGQGNGDNYISSVSADGRFLAFQSDSTNLIPGVWGEQIYVKDVQTGALSLASSTVSGVQGNGVSSSASLSADGRFIAFSSNSTNLIPGVSGNQIYLKDLETGALSLASSTESAVQGNDWSGDTSLSADGRFLAFRSFSTNLIPGVSGEQIYVKDLQTGALSLASSTQSGVQGNGFKQKPILSADGRFIAFQATSTNLIPGTSGWEIYVKDLQTGALSLASTSSSGVEGNGDSFISSVSADGRFLAFQSNSTNLIPGVSGTQTYIKDLQTGALSLASSNKSGTQGNGLSSGGSLSADGRFLAFSSNSTNLIPGVGGTLQAYRKDLQTGELELVNRSSAGTIVSGGAGGISSDGSKVFFDSFFSGLVEGDTNGTLDIFLRDLSKTGVNELAGVVVSNQASASVTLGMMRDRIEALSLVQSGIGASISRIEFAISNLSSTTEALATAKSQIMDADIAEESSKLVSNQILQQAGVAVLAQANAQTELILSLLKFKQS